MDFAPVQLMHDGVRDDGYFAYLNPVSGVLAHDLHDENVARLPETAASSSATDLENLIVRAGPHSVQVAGASRASPLGRRLAARLHSQRVRLPILTATKVHSTKRSTMSGRESHAIPLPR